MDPTLLAYLVQDGLTNGAIYALLGVALIVVFAVTRVIFIPQGDLVTIAALSLLVMETGRVPGSVWLLIGLAAASLCGELIESRGASRSSHIRLVLIRSVLPMVVAALVFLLVPLRLGLPVSILLTTALTLPLGPYLYRVVFQPLADASVPTLLMAAVGAHIAGVGLCLLMFGPEGWRGGVGLGRIDIAGFVLSGQSVAILFVAIALLMTLSLAFGRTRWGKALRASAGSPRGARLVGISPHASGRVAFALATAIALISAVLIVPVTTIYYDSGFLIGLKGFVAAVMAGLSSFPSVVLAALSIGLLEAVSAFWLSSYKEVLVFASVLPILLWRSLRQRVGGGGEG